MQIDSIETAFLLAAFLLGLVGLFVLFRDLWRTYIEPLATLGAYQKAVRALGGTMSRFPNKGLSQKLRLVGMPDQDIEKLAGWKKLYQAEFDTKFSSWMMAGAAAGAALSAANGADGQWEADSGAVYDDDDFNQIYNWDDPLSPAAQYLGMATDISADSDSFDPFG